EAGPSCAGLAGVGRDLLAYSHDVCHRFYRGGQGEIARQLHLARILVDVAELALSARPPVLAIAKDRNERAEGDDLMIRRAVRQTLGVIIGVFWEGDLLSYTPLC